MTRSLHLRQVIGPVLGLAGFAIAFAATSTASAQDGAAPAGTTAPTTTAAPAGTTAAPTTTDEEEAKKKAAAEEEAKKKAAAEAAPATPPPTTAPATTTGGSNESGATVTFGATGPKKDEPSAAAKKDEPAPPLQPWRGSLLILDQSMTTNTFKKDAQLSYQPVYEWWISPRIAYNFSKTVRLTVRQDLFKEWTNVNETTDRGEWRYTDTWLTLAYRPTEQLAKISKHLTGAVSLTLRPGISKESRGASQYFAGGPGASVAYSFDLAGEKAKAFKAFNISAGLNYQHSFSRCNTACASDFVQKRQNSDGQPVDDNQLRAGSLVGNQLLYSANLGLDIVEHLDFSASMIWISQWANRTSDTTFAGTDLGRANDDTRLRQFSWFFTQVTWGFMKEASLAAGYYNLNTVVHPDGEYRNPFWSPDARIFLDVYVHLDAIYEKFTSGEAKKGSGPSGGGRVF